MSIFLDLTNDPESDIESSSDISYNEDLSIEEIKKIVWKRFCPIDKDLGNCFCCNDQISKKKTHVEFGHIIPKSKGGEYTVDNIRPICITCNRGKGGMHTMNMYEYIVRNNMYGLKHIPKNKQQLYIYDNRERKKVIKKCVELLNNLSNNKSITKIFKDELHKIIINNNIDVESVLFQNTITYIKTLKDI